tara:strand:+ start:241 stop:672 length:432 start_codon:yes stop_codon:yes gene_type:complete
MLKRIQKNLGIKKEIIALILFIILTISLTSYHNLTQKIIKNNVNDIINNIYFKKTTDHFLGKLEPKFKKIKHQILEGETFDNILNQYLVDKKQIQDLKVKLSKKIDLNKLKTNQKIYLTIDQSDNKIKNFILQISNKKKNISI